MVSWSAFADEEPEMAEAGRAIWADHVVMYLATIRPDGSPRVHPVVPVLVDGHVCVAIPQASPKWRDLDRDPRCVLHALPGARDDEFVLRCRAQPAEHLREDMRAAADHRVHDGDRLFAFDLEQVDLGHWEHIGEPDTYSVRYRWVPGSITQVKP